MLTLLTTDDFAAWFRGLSDEDAEDVAVALGLIEALGPTRMAPGSTELLLWYQSPAADRLRVRFAEEFGQFTSGMRRIVRHLESESVAQRLAEVSSDRARTAHDAIRMLLLRARFSHFYSAKDEKITSAVFRHYRTLLEALDLEEPKDEEPAQPALRQIDIAKRTPGMRVLYGVDAAHERVLLVLGESLDGCAYGPSVRKALSIWQEFLRGGRVVAEASAVGSSR
ncbi:MAG TPA: hypothetical protein VFG30_02110 [Polyangiales bacterium]|nr:hypothetical protein [Polyangiales bacterium]